MNLATILAETLDPATKGYPLAGPALPISAIGAQRWSVLNGDLPLPLAVIRDSALAHNHAWMRDFTASTGVLLAPHGICVRFGVRRVLMANQLLGAAEVGAVIRLREEHPDLEFHFLIDSQAQLASIEHLAASQKMSRKLTALVELGVPGGRTGCRTFDEAMAVARAIATSKNVALSGLECYEGLQVNGDSARDTAMVGALMQRVKNVALACDAEKLFAGTSIILTAGGSAAFDIVARDLPLRLSRPVLTILRSGCYVTHDSGFYNRMLEQVKARSGATWQTRAGLQPALEVWSRVQSCPEAGLSILTMGKRDASFDLDLPVPI